MTTNTRSSPIKVAVVGLGYQGKGIAELLQEEGYELTGAVDVDDKVGAPLSDYVPHARTPDVPIFGSMDELLRNTEKPDVMALAIAVPAPVAADVAADILRRGINVVTLTEDLFEGQGELVEMLDVVARENGVTLIAGGLQDLMWVQLPATAAASVSHLSEVVLDDIADASVFPFVGGQLEAGMCMTPEEFDEWKAHREIEPPIQGAPLRELARTLGFQPIRTTCKITPFFASEPAYWSNADVTVPAGKTLGARFVTHIETAEGVDFRGFLIFKLAEGTEISCNNIILKGRTTLRLIMPNFVANPAVWLGIVRRIENVVLSEPGVVRVATLGSAKYVHPVS